MVFERHAKTAKLTHFSKSVLTGLFLTVLTGVIPSLASAEWRVLGPMMESPDWLDQAAIDMAKQAEAAALAVENADMARENWHLAETQRRGELPRMAETVSVDGGARLGFGCSPDGDVFLTLVISGYEIEAGIVTVTHWVDDNPPSRVPWFSVPAGLELKIFTDRDFYVDQFLETVSGGETLTMQVETFPQAEFAAPNRQQIVAPILKNCIVLSKKIKTPARFMPETQEPETQEPDMQETAQN